MLDEECKLGQGTDNSLVAKLHSKFGPEGQGKGAKPGHPFYGKPVTDPKSFFIRHYAADVTYDVTGMLLLYLKGGVGGNFLFLFFFFVATGICVT